MCLDGKLAAVRRSGVHLLGCLLLARNFCERSKGKDEAASVLPYDLKPDCNFAFGFPQA